MDFTNYLIGYILRVIPREVIDLAVTDRRYRAGSHVSLETRLETSLLKPSFLLDMSLITGVEMVIPIGKLPFINEQDGVSVLKIPDRILQGRKLINALSLANNVEQKGMFANDALGANQELMSRNADWTYADSTTKLEVISHNEVLVYDNMSNLSEMALRVTVQLSDNFGEINTKSYPQLANLALKAVKMMIHTSLIVKIGQSQLYHGHELSIIESTVSEYSDAYTEYFENLYMMKKTVFMNDSVSMTRYIQNMIPNVV